MQQLTELTAHRIDMEKSTQGHNISTHIEIDLKKKPPQLLRFLWVICGSFANTRSYNDQHSMV